MDLNDRPTCPDCDVYPVREGNEKCIHCMAGDRWEAKHPAPWHLYLR
jgi:hypothetical protein